MKKKKLRENIDDLTSDVEYWEGKYCQLYETKAALETRVVLLEKAVRLLRFERNELREKANGGSSRPLWDTAPHGEEFAARVAESALSQPSPSGPEPLSFGQRLRRRFPVLRVWCKGE